MCVCGSLAFRVAAGLACCGLVWRARHIKLVLCVRAYISAPLLRRLAMNSTALGTGTSEHNGFGGLARQPQIGHAPAQMASNSRAACAHTHRQKERASACRWCARKKRRTRNQTNDAHDALQRTPCNTRRARTCRALKGAGMPCAHHGTARACRTCVFMPTPPLAPNTPLWASLLPRGLAHTRTRTVKRLASAASCCFTYASCTQRAGQRWATGSERVRNGGRTRRTLPDMERLQVLELESVLRWDGHQVSSPRRLFFSF